MRRLRRRWDIRYFNPRSQTGATYQRIVIIVICIISIHAPKRERPKQQFSRTYICDFNPRSQTGATEKKEYTVAEVNISIHAPKRERRDPTADKAVHNAISIHAPKRERRTDGRWSVMFSEFQSTLPNGSD